MCHQIIVAIVSKIQIDKLDFSIVFDFNFPFAAEKGRKLSFLPETNAFQIASEVRSRCINNWVFPINIARVFCDTI